MTVFALNRLTRVYDDRTVLDIENLEIKENDIYALLGPNGAGKTTLLNILGFLERPTAGSICYRSKPVRFVESELQILRREVIMVDQFPILFSTTVFKNLEFGLKIRGIPKKKRLGIIEEALDLVGMRAFASARAHRLSGGETQRVALARALALSPKVFLCDEPTSSVDVENQAIIVNILKQINESKRLTLVFTTHDRLQAANLAHHTLVLDHGKTVESGYENVFSGVVHQDDNGNNRCAVHPDVTLEMASNEKLSAHEKVRIFIDPNQIILCPHDEKQKPQNVLQGRVRQIMEENSKIRVVVDTGVWFTLMISDEVYRKNRVTVGDIIDFIVPPGAVRTAG